MKTILPLFCLLCFGFLWSCEPIQSYKDVLEVSFNCLSIEAVATPFDEPERKAILVFSFIDGNGNIGERSDDCTKSICVSRVHYAWLKLKNTTDDDDEVYSFPEGEYVLHHSASISFPYNSAMYKDGANNTTLKGSVKMPLSMLFNQQGLDKMRIKFFIVDRKGKESNIDFTPSFSILNPPNVTCSQ